MQIIAIGLYLMPLAATFDWLQAAAMGAAVILTVATGIDYVVRAAAVYSRAKAGRVDGPPPTGAG